MDPRALPGVAVLLRELPPGAEQSAFAHAVLEEIRAGFEFTSVSHSGELIAVAAADGPVGIDVERAVPGRRWKEIALRTWSEAPASEREFYERWTRHEALLKARGVGLFSANCKLQTANWTATALDTPPGYTGTLVTELVP